MLLDFLTYRVDLPQLQHEQLTVLLGRFRALRTDADRTVLSAHGQDDNQPRL